MRRDNLFSFRVSNYERQLIITLAKELRRTKSDAVRFVVMNAINDLDNKQHISSQDQPYGNPDGLHQK